MRFSGQSPGGGSSDGHGGCRVREFARWDRVLLEHERAYLSRCMLAREPYSSDAEKRAMLHDLTDIDYCLANLRNEATGA